jgi:hypothetical protein
LIGAASFFRVEGLFAGDIDPLEKERAIYRLFS